MNKNIIDFYMFTNRLKSKLRTGWLEIEISKDRIESIAEHVYGTLMLALVIDYEYELNIDMLKVLKMLSLHELEEILMPDYTLRSNITPNEKIENGKISVSEVVKNLIKKEEIKQLLNEFNERKTKEAKFCYMIDKIECDFQAKLYDLEGNMDYDKAKVDLNYYGNRAKDIEKNSKCASDFWLEYDRPRYNDDEIFKKLIDDIKNIDINNYKDIMNREVNYVRQEI